MSSSRGWEIEIFDIEKTQVYGLKGFFLCGSQTSHSNATNHSLFEIGKLA
jgi:hypothetical protein